MALAVPLSRFTPRVGGGSAFFVRLLRAFMTIRYQTWRRVTRVGSIVVIPFVLFLFLRPHWGVWSHRLEITSYIVLFSFAGAGALLAILTRVGVVRMIYSDADKQSISYMMSKQKDSDDKPAA